MHAFVFQEVLRPGLTDTLQHLIAELDGDPTLLLPHQLRKRLQALDRLDLCFPDAALPRDPQAELDPETIGAGLHRRATAIRARLEAVNCSLYSSIRRGIQKRSRPVALLRYVDPSPNSADPSSPINGSGYDYLDELIVGVLQFEEPGAVCIPRGSEKVFYQPTPARHIFNLIGLARLASSDVLVDIGSGLGHVPLLVSICTHARCIGIECETAYVQRARQCAQSLNLKEVRFVDQDAREADLSTGTVFYLYTPFSGSMLRAVLDRLRREAATRRIRVCSYGPCTSVIAEEPWLEASTPPDTHRIALFHSRD